MIVYTTNFHPFKGKNPSKISVFDGKKKKTPPLYSGQPLKQIEDLEK